MQPNHNGGQTEIHQPRPADNDKKRRIGKNLRRTRQADGQKTVVVSFRLELDEAEIVSQNRSATKDAIIKMVQTIREENEAKLWHAIGQELAEQPYEWESSWQEAALVDANKALDNL